MTVAPAISEAAPLTTAVLDTVAAPVMATFPVMAVAPVTANAPVRPILVAATATLLASPTTVRIGAGVPAFDNTWKRSVAAAANTDKLPPLTVAPAISEAAPLTTAVLDTVAAPVMATFPVTAVAPVTATAPVRPMAVAATATLLPSPTTVRIGAGVPAFDNTWKRSVAAAANTDKLPPLTVAPAISEAAPLTTAVLDTVAAPVTATAPVRPI